MNNSNNNNNKNPFQESCNNNAHIFVVDPNLKRSVCKNCKILYDDYQQIKQKEFLDK